MTCRNLCERLDTKIIVGKSIYEEGKKYCRRCEVYFLHDGSFCPCCGIRLRVSPVNKKGRNRKKENGLAHL
jgi:rRNA maturation endonuclease Nob1